jgi:hypothetical protein
VTYPIPSSDELDIIPEETTMDLPDIGYKAFWTAIAAFLSYLSTVTIDVGAEWTPLVTTVFTAVLVAAREWVARRNTTPEPG